MTALGRNEDLVGSATWRERVTIAWRALRGQYEVFTYSQWLESTPTARKAHVDLPIKETG